MQTEKIIDYIVSWMRDYAQKAGVRGFVVGISGGIDSAVVSTLAAKTGLEVLLLDMPIRQKTKEKKRAKEQITFLKQRFPKVSGLEVDLTQVFNSFENTIDAEPYPSRDLALANSRARLRMLTLYYYGQIHGLLVAGTGNKIEDFGVGFFTKYGDGGVDLSPIADLLKTQVYQLAEALGVPESIREAIPTDGLWDTERTDEQQMGATYPELEWAMQTYEAGADPEDFEGRKREVLEIYIRLNRAAQHKIKPIPVCKIPVELFLDTK